MRGKKKKGQGAREEVNDGQRARQGTCRVQEIRKKREKCVREEEGEGQGEERGGRTGC